MEGIKAYPILARLANQSILIVTNNDRNDGKLWKHIELHFELNLGKILYKIANEILVFELLVAQFYVSS